MNLLFFFVLLVATILSVSGEITPVTPENYAHAETQFIFSDYKDDIAAATGTNGIGVMFQMGIMDADSRSIVRPNFDTLYSMALLDLTEPATLVMPETNGRYQSAWLVNEDHYNPYAINEAGTYEITKENTGSQYVFMAFRTAVNTKDEADNAKAMDLLNKIELSQASAGDYNPVEEYDYEEVLGMRDYYLKVLKEKDYKSGQMFGAKGTMSLEQHNAGTAYGWGGFTEEQAVYLTHFFDDATPGTLTLKNVPVAKNAFWSVTVYDNESFATGETYNINSLFAVPNDEGEYVIHFGGDKDADNYLDIYEDWNYTLRLYLPQEEYFEGEWEEPRFIPSE